MMENNKTIIDTVSEKEQVGDLIFTISFEDRCILSLKRIINNFTINNFYLINFCDYFEYNHIADEKDKKTADKYITTYREVKKYLNGKNIDFKEIRGHLFKTDEIIEYITSTKFNYPLLVDISCMPRTYILSILPIIKLDESLFIYSKVGEYSNIETDFVIGNRKIIALPDFRGIVRHRDSILILILGFQGNRAMSIFRKFNPYRTLALIPNPRDDAKDENIRIVRENNCILLNNQFVRDKEITVFNPIKFKSELESYIESFLEEEHLNFQDFNIILSHLGPKPDVLGLYEYWTKNKKIQISYSLPTRYRDYSKGIGDTYIIKYSDIK